MITIRKANNQDVPGIRQCVDNAYRHYITRLGKPPGPMLDDYAEIVSKHRVYVAQADRTIVGLLVLMEDHSPVLLDNLAVDPVQQGTGLGKRLLTLAEDLMRESGHSTLQLYTHELMHENVNYYRKHGYQISHRVSEKGYQRIYMRKQLNRLAKDSFKFRSAQVDDAMAIARLHALSWQRTYKGILDDGYLSHEVLPEKQNIWLKAIV